MKVFIPVILCFSVALFLWIDSAEWSFSQEDYLPEKVLELSYPIDVTIDVELLRDLGPAYEY